MKFSVYTCAAAVLAIALSASVLAANWTAQVGQVQASHLSLDCFFFTLDGVSTADPVLPGSPWFAMQRSQLGARDAYALLLTAKATGAAVQVATTGASVCGYAQAHAITLQ